MPSLRTHAFFPHWFPREAVQTFGLNPAEQLVFYVIADQCDARGVSRTSQRLLMDRTGRSRSSVQTALGRLLKLGLVERSWPSGAKAAAQYTIPDAMPALPSTIAAPTRRDEELIRERRQA